MYVLLKYGLCNRLRTIVGFWYLAEKYNKRIIFHWDDDEHCNGKFTDIFESIDCENCELVDDIQVPIVYLFIGQNVIRKIIQQFTSYFIDEECGNVDVTNEDIENIQLEFYQRFIPLFYIQYNVNCFINTHFPDMDFAAMHVRRTDHVEVAKRNNAYTSFDEFDEFVKRNNRKIFLLTDCEDVQKRYPYCIVYDTIIPSKNLRQTSLENALIDILIASKAKYFKGSGYSSFTGIINTYRKILEKIKNE